MDSERLWQQTAEKKETQRKMVENKEIQIHAGNRKTQHEMQTKKPKVIKHKKGEHRRF